MTNPMTSLMANDVLELESDQFRLHKSKKSMYVCLKNTKLELSFSKSEPAYLVIKFEDIAGSAIAKSKKDSDTMVYLTVYAYLFVNKKKSRKRKQVELEYDVHKTYNENMSVVNVWHKRIDQLIKQNITQKYLDQTQSILEQINKPFIVFVNPKSGSGLAKSVYQERILSVWSESNVSHKVVFTQYANHARELVKSLNVDEYRGILVVSGDGLVYEVINGLMERPDWQKAIRIPFGQLPGGSANALACSIAYLANEPFEGLSLEQFASNCAFNMSKSLGRATDLCTYELCNKSVVHSFLSFEWAIVADVDSESEKYRFLGALRFTLGAVKRILKLRKYRGRLSFLVSDDFKDFKPKDSTIKVLKSADQNQNITRTEQDSDRKFKYLRPLDQQVPSDWLTIEENFVFFLIVSKPLIAPTFIAAPDSKLDDGNMHLIFIKEGITKFELVQLFDQTESGSHLNNPKVEYCKIKAFRLEPLVSESTEKNGVMMVDGEHVPYGMIQAEVAPGIARILSK